MPVSGYRHYPKSGIHGRVVHELGREIVTGHLKPGEKLPSEAELETRFAGSRTAIREAFRVLTAKGLLEARQRAGTLVRTREYWDLLDPDILYWQGDGTPDPLLQKQVTEFRLCFQPGIVRMVVARATEAQLEALSEQMKYMIAALDRVNRPYFVQSVQKFHGLMFDYSMNEYAVRLFETVETQLDALYSAIPDHDLNASGILRWYAVLMDRIAQRDAAGAEQQLKNIIEKESQLFLSYLRPRMETIERVA